VSRVESVNTVTSNADVFFFDRVSRGILDLAAIARQNGATIVFEPSASCDEKHFLEAYALSDIVKYARDRRPKFAESLDKAASHRRATLEIETRGADGLAFRLGTERRWRARGAVRVEKLRDASGAGDWLTAGFLYAAAREGAISSALADASSIEKAFAIGQALAAFNCQFEGPRGAMYASSADTTAQMLNVVDTRARRMLTSQPKRPPLRMTLTGVCATCAGNARGTPRNHGGIPSTAATQVRVPRARARVGLL
jgi:fructokinase